MTPSMFYPYEKVYCSHPCLACLLCLVYEISYLGRFEHFGHDGLRCDLRYNLVVPYYVVLNCNIKTVGLKISRKERLE